ncbi:MAG: hypothetical protein WAN43_16320 [Rhodomicrobium sp.]
MLGFYRRADCSDPEVFVAGVAAALACYSPEIAAKACDPRSGLPAAIKWLPNVAEVHEFCRREASRHARAAESEARIAEQAAERERVAAAHAGQGDDERRKAFVAAELARLGELGRRSEGEPDPTQLDVRGMPEGPARRALEAKLEAHIEALRARNCATPAGISAETLATFGKAEAAADGDGGEAMPEVR